MRNLIHHAKNRTLVRAAAVLALSSSLGACAGGRRFTWDWSWFFG